MYVCVCVCVCVSEKERERERECVCVCVFERERERERDADMLRYIPRQKSPMCLSLSDTVGLEPEKSNRVLQDLAKAA